MVRPLSRAATEGAGQKVLLIDGAQDVRGATLEGAVNHCRDP